ncbi:FAD-dependent monooxygenase [candidate division KSB1 bacterium]|nr:FAD-dependent monooxygenase [candidate division KSB1 bacterium]
MSQNQITLIGAGLAGSLLSIYLAKRGFEVEIFERRPDMRSAEISAGRSINLALSVRGLHALEKVGLKERIMQIAIPMKGRMLHSLTGELNLVPYGRKESEVINSVSRAELNMQLMSAAEQQGVEIHFNQKCTGMDFESGELKLHDEVTNQDSVTQKEIVIGTDGSASAIRNDMARALDGNFTKDDLEHGYKELTLPAGRNGQFLLEKNALHIWPRQSYMLIALPNSDGSFTCTLFFPMRGDLSFESLKTKKAVLAFFKEQFPDAFELMPALVEDFFTNPTGALATIRCQPWHLAGKACLLGDAAHAIVPFFGQGINCGFEDCTVLDECIENQSGDWQKIFQEFGTLRKINTDAIAELSLTNYFEMRDHVADSKFALKKQVEFALEEKYPEKFIPKYSMVSFHRIPYSVALAKGKLQEKILAELCAAITSVEDLDWQRADELIKN